MSTLKTKQNKKDKQDLGTDKQIIGTQKQRSTARQCNRLAIEVSFAILSVNLIS